MSSRYTASDTSSSMYERARPHPPLHGTLSRKRERDLAKWPLARRQGGGGGRGRGGGMPLRGMHRHWRRRGPPPFLRWMFAPLIFWAAIALISMLFRTRTLAIVAIAVLALAIGFVLAFRRASSFFRAQDRLRRQLMADVAHELRTPLSILQGRIEGLLDGVYPRDDARMAGLLEETQHLSRLVEDLRTPDKSEAGALDLRKEVVDPADLVPDPAGAFGRKIEVDRPADNPLIGGHPGRAPTVS